MMIQDDNEQVYDRASTGRMSVIDSKNNNHTMESIVDTIDSDMNTTSNNKSTTSSSTTATDTNTINDQNITYKEDYRRRSPAAQALFNAFDLQASNNVGRIEPTTPITSKSTIISNDQGKNQQVKSKVMKSQYIQKQIQILGWRNRYSQSEYYPITIQQHLSPNHPSRNDIDITKVSTTTSLTTFHVKQVQRGEIENTYGTGATVWPASIVLIKYIERHAKELIYNQTIIDLGTGTGITSIVAALLGAKHIICTDGEESVVQLAKENILNVALECSDTNNNNVAASTTSDIVGNNQSDHPNNINTSTNKNKNNSDSYNSHMDTTVQYINHCPIEVQQYWWSTGTIQSTIIKNKPIKHIFDIILISDCVLPKLYPIEPLIDAIDQLLYLPSESESKSSVTEHDSETDTCTNQSKNNNETSQHNKKQMAIVSYEHRYYELYDPRVYVKQLCDKRQLQIDIVPIEEQDEIYSIPDDIEIWHIYRK